MDRLATVAQPRRYRPREAVFHAGDTRDRVYVVDRGFVKIMLGMPDGSWRTIDIIGPGDCFGLLSLARRGPQPFRIETLDVVYALAIPIDIVRQILHTTPRFAEQTISLLADRVEVLTQQLREMYLGSVASRLAARLVSLAHRHGKQVGSAVHIEIPLVQRDLAEMVGANRSTVNQWLGWYENQGIIVREHRRIVILDIEYLRAKAR